VRRADETESRGGGVEAVRRGGGLRECVYMYTTVAKATAAADDSAAARCCRLAHATTIAVLSCG